MKIPHVFAALLIAAGPAAAHVTLAGRQASPGSSYLAVFKVPHGCEGAATTAIRVKIPAGVTSAKPMPKPGWAIEIKTGKYDKPFTDKGAAMTEGVTEVSWSAGNLPDAYYDEFTLSTTLADSLATGSTLYFPVVQECERGAVDRWIEIPAPGKSADDYKTPAPGVKLVPRQ